MEMRDIEIEDFEEDFDDNTDIKHHIHPVEINSGNSHYLIIGLGITGVSLIRYFQKKNISVFVYDDNDTKISEILKEFDNTKRLEINEYADILDENSIIFPSPGVALYGEKESEIVKIVKFNNCRISSDIEIFLENIKQYPKIKTISVSGTNGKTTMCHLIKTLLENAGYKSHIYGNTDAPVLSLDLEKEENIDFCIIEISSFQAELLTSHASFDISIILNITNDHLDRHITLENYVIAKYRILNGNNTIAICNPSTGFEQTLFNSLKNKTKINIYDCNFGNTKINKETKNLNLPCDSIYSLYTLAQQIKIDNDIVQQTLESFKPLAHRMELILDNKVLSVFNDSKGTNFHATSYALQNKKNVIWIGCGILKVGDTFFENIETEEIKLAIFFGQDKEKFYQLFKDKIKNIHIENGVNSTIDYCLQFIIDRKNNQKYNIIFSPAGASFDMWNGYDERGDAFKNALFMTVNDKYSETIPSL